MNNRNPKRKSQSQKNFAKAPSANIQRSRFDRSCTYKTAFDSSQLIPFYCEEVLPGDDVRLSISALGRLATPIHPLMDNMRITVFWFFVPNRLGWTNWQKFMGEQENPGDSTDFTIPQITNAAGWGLGTMGDYFALPTGITNTTTSALPFRAVNRIIRDWFRDENLQNSPLIHTSDGPDGPSSYPIVNRGKRHDYFTSCLPWPQKGPGVDLPLGDTAPVVLATNVSASDITFGYQTPVQAYRMNTSGATGTVGATGDASTNVLADLSQATGATINDLRQAFAIQKLQERDARGGTRYTEILRSHFRVTSPDARLQRAEYLGGGQAQVQIQTVPQTGATGTDTSIISTPQGNLSGYGTASMSGNGFSKGFVEHGYIIGMLSAQADLTYQQGIERHWSRATKYDFYWPALQSIGEQAVLNKEIYYNDDANDEMVFGYQERFAEMRYSKNKITNLFRSSATASLDAWHLAQDFDALPVLNDSFIQDNAPVDRVIAVPTEPHFLFDSYIQQTWTRPMPTYGVPGYIDHF